MKAVSDQPAATPASREELVKFQVTLASRVRYPEWADARLPVAKANR